MKFTENEQTDLFEFYGRVSKHGSSALGKNCRVKNVL